MTDFIKIFVVDGDDSYRQQVVAHISKLPIFKVRDFSSGEACIDYMHNEIPNIIILDYVLNDANPNAANGLEIIEKIKKLFHGIHIIVLSSRIKYGMAATTILKGAEHYVMKDENALKAIDKILEEYI